jgi:hypothetical protein
MLVNYAKTANALEVAWYAMEKHAPAECCREIATSKAILIRIGSLPDLSHKKPTPHEPHHI